MDSNDVIDTFQFEYIKNNWGSCHIEAFPSIVAKMLNNFIKENRSIFVGFNLLKWLILLGFCGLQGKCGVLELYFG